MKLKTLQTKSRRMQLELPNEAAIFLLGIYLREMKATDIYIKTWERGQRDKWEWNPLPPVRGWNS